MAVSKVVSAVLHLEGGRWYGWQMLPGYGEGAPYFSPIYMRDVAWRTDDGHVLELDFTNVMYAAGVQNFRLALRVLLQQQSFVVGEILDEDSATPSRAAVISTIGFEWLEQCCAHILRAHPHTARSVASVAQYLTEIFLEPS